MAFSDQTDLDSCLIVLTLNAERIGCYKASDLLEIIKGTMPPNTPVYFIVHSFLGHSPNFINTITEKIKPLMNYIWVHDFSTLCSNYALLRNNVEFCASPDIDSNACMVCSYGTERLAHLTKVKTIFERLCPIVFVPSQAARDFWMSRCNYNVTDVQVAPHAEPIWNGILPKALHSPARLNIAFAGAAAHHKGWQVFSDLVWQLKGDIRYQFFHLSSSPATYPARVTHIPVSVSAQSRFAMTEALANNNIHAVINWSLCFETFSFVTYESILSGALVICKAGSGNAAVVAGDENGVIVNSAEDLLKLFKSDDIGDLIRIHLGNSARTGQLNPVAAGRRIVSNGKI